LRSRSFDPLVRNHIDSHYRFFRKPNGDDDATIAAN
jgi:hypothetical protein